MTVLRAPAPAKGDSHVRSVEYSRTTGEGAAAFEVAAFGGGVYRASLVAQLVKIPPAMRETWVQSLGWEDPLEKERLPTPVFWPGEFRGLYSHGVTKSLTRLTTFTTTT